MTYTLIRAFTCFGRVIRDSLPFTRTHQVTYPYLSHISPSPNDCGEYKGFRTLLTPWLSARHGCLSTTERYTPSELAGSGSHLYAFPSARHPQ